jgi:hypothetical protein
MMQARKNDDTHEGNQSLWLLVASPTIWAAHFLASYLTAAIWCAKFAGPDKSLGVVRTAIAVYTVLALVGVVYTGFVGYQRNRYEHRTFPHDGDSSEDRHRFLGFASLLLSGISAIAILFVAVAAFIIGACH